MGITLSFAREAIRFGLVCALALALTACGGGGGSGEAGNGVSVPSLETGKEKDKPSPSALDLPKAPTDAHGGLARLLPAISQAIIEGSIAHGGWDAASCNFFSGRDLDDEAVRKTPLPAVTARYVSTGYRVENLPAGGNKDKATVLAHQNLPQSCNLYLVHAPDAAAATTLERRVLEKLKQNGFGEISPLRGLVGEGPAAEMKRMLRVEPGDNGMETAHVAYTRVIGNRFCYALESETRSTILRPDGTPDPAFTDRQRGSSLGGQLLLLVETNAARKP